MLRNVIFKITEMKEMGTVAKNNRKETRYKDLRVICESTDFNLIMSAWNRLQIKNDTRDYVLSVDFGTTVSEFMKNQDFNNVAISHLNHGKENPIIDNLTVLFKDGSSTKYDSVKDMLYIIDSDDHREIDKIMILVNYVRKNNTIRRNKVMYDSETRNARFLRKTNQNYAHVEYNSSDNDQR